MQARERPAKMARMSPEQLVGLEEAQAALGQLYARARRFRSLRRDADEEFLPTLTRLGLELRQAWRGGGDAPDAIAQAIADLERSWRERLDGMRASTPYQAAREALASGDVGTLRSLVSELCADLEVVTPAPRLYFAVRVAQPRKRAGDPPFVSAETCVGKLQRLLQEGMRPPESDAEGWDGDFPALAPSEDPYDHDSPVSLVVAAGRADLALLRDTTTQQLTVITRHVAPPFSVALVAETSDGWWDTNEETYPAFRDGVAAALRALALPVEIVAES